MPQLGEIKQAYKINRKGYNKWAWLACEGCGKERWVQLLKGMAVNKHCETCCKVGRLNGNWTGGRANQGGYILIKLPRNDFFYPMADQRRYVREHRLVVAKALKRCLLPWEVVHHKGTKYPLGSIKNKQDNRYPENLELLGSNSKHNKEIERLIKQARDDGFEAGMREARVIYP